MQKYLTPTLLNKNPDLIQDTNISLYDGAEVEGMHCDLSTPKLREISHF